MGKITTVGIDLAKNVFSVHAVDEAGQVVLRKTITRARLMATVAQWPLCSIGMEGSACGPADGRGADRQAELLGDEAQGAARISQGGGCLGGEECADHLGDVGARHAIQSRLGGVTFTHRITWRAAFAARNRSDRRSENLINFGADAQAD